MVVRADADAVRVITCISVAWFTLGIPVHVFVNSGVLIWGFIAVVLIGWIGYARACCREGSKPHFPYRGDQVAVIIGAIILVVVLAGIPIVGVVAWYKQPNRRTIRQAWAEAPHSQRWDWSVRLLYFPLLFGSNIPLLPAWIRATGFGAVITLLIVGGTGYSQARRREGNPVDVAGTLRRARTHLRAVFRRSS